MPRSGLEAVFKKKGKTFSIGTSTSTRFHTSPVSSLCTRRDCNVWLSVGRCGGSAFGSRAGYKRPRFLVPCSTFWRGGCAAPYSVPSVAIASLHRALGPTRRCRLGCRGTRQSACMEGSLCFVGRYRRPVPRSNANVPPSDPRTAPLRALVQTPLHALLHRTRPLRPASPAIPQSKPDALLLLIPTQPCSHPLRSRGIRHGTSVTFDEAVSSEVTLVY